MAAEKTRTCPAPRGFDDGSPVCGVRSQPNDPDGLCPHHSLVALGESLGWAISRKAYTASRPGEDGLRRLFGSTAQELRDLLLADRGKAPA
jgi:hypothetical protein